MATKKKTKSKVTKKKAGKKAPTRKSKKLKTPKKSAKKRPVPKKAPAKKTAAKRPEILPEEPVVLLPVGPGSRSAGQSGDLQGLSDREGADSESVDELLEEGNSFEAGVVSGVEDADNGEREVHTHEVPEDDVPDEYRDKD